jgi:hypothetical protein
VLSAHIEGLFAAIVLSPGDANSASSPAEDPLRFAQSERLSYVNGDASARHEVVAALFWASP